MGFFGKTKKSELEAATAFVLTFFEHGQAHWPSIRADLQILDPQFAILAKDKVAAYELTLAAIASHLHAVENLLPADQASRVRAHVLECLSRASTSNYPREAIAEYDAAWDNSLSQVEPPFIGVASVLYDKLRLSSSVSVGTAVFKNPYVTMALGGAVVQFAGPWWKNYVETYRIVA